MGKWAGVVAGCVLSACASSSSGSSTVSAQNSSFSGNPYVTAVSDDGALHVAVRTDPEPPPRGTCNIELTVTDANGAPQDGLALSVVPWMPAMGHGSSTKPTVLDEGGGRYLVSNVNMFMPGEWELRCSFSGSVTTHAVPIIAVP